MEEQNKELSSNEPKKKNDGNRRNRRYRGGKRYGKKDFPNCPICGNSVKDMSTAIAFGDEGAPAHFDCILKQLEARETLESDEKICYLGNGSFGIIKTRAGGPMKFFVRKRIQYEEAEKKYDWRKKVSKRIKK